MAGGPGSAEDAVAGQKLLCSISGWISIIAMRLLLDNLPPSLKGQREAIERCLRAMAGAMPLREVYLFSLVANFT